MEGLSAVAAPVAWIEFAVQRGLDRLVMESGGGAVRLHSIGGPELHGLEPGTAVARWVRAVVERSVRALYLRFYTESPPGYPALTGQELLDLNLSYVGAIAAGLEQRGFALGPAAALRLPAVGAAVVFVIFLSVAAAAPVAAAIRPSAGCGGGLTLWPSPVRFRFLAIRAEARSLRCVVIFQPWLPWGYCAGWRAGRGARGLGVAGQAPRRWSASSGRYTSWGFCPDTLCVGIDLFWGVKAMHVLPPLLIAGAFLWERPVCGAAILPNKRRLCCGVRFRWATSCCSVRWRPSHWLSYYRHESVAGAGLRAVAAHDVGEHVGRTPAIRSSCSAIRFSC